MQREEERQEVVEIQGADKPGQFCEARLPSRANKLQLHLVRNEKLL